MCGVLVQSCILSVPKSLLRADPCMCLCSQSWLPWDYRKQERLKSIALVSSVLWAGFHGLATSTRPRRKALSRPPISVLAYSTYSLATVGFPSSWDSPRLISIYLEFRIQTMSFFYQNILFLSCFFKLLFIFSNIPDILPKATNCWLTYPVLRYFLWVWQCLRSFDIRFFL